MAKYEVYMSGNAMYTYLLQLCTNIVTHIHVIPKQIGRCDRQIFWELLRDFWGIIFKNFIPRHMHITYCRWHDIVTYTQLYWHFKDIKNHEKNCNLFSNRCCTFPQWLLLIMLCCYCLSFPIFTLPLFVAFLSM